MILEFAHAAPTLIFFIAAAGIIPTAALMGKATEHLAERSGPGIGGLLNVTFGNAPELIIAAFALNEGLQEVVKASIIGSILGNVLLVLGVAMIAGGVGRGGEVQKFDRTAASVQSIMLLLAGVRAAHARRLRADRGPGPAVGERRARPVRLDGRGALGRGLGGARPLLRRRALLLAEDARGVFNPAGEEDAHGAAGEPWSVRRVDDLAGGRRRSRSA